MTLMEITMLVFMMLIVVNFLVLRFLFSLSTRDATTCSTPFAALEALAYIGTVTFGWIFPVFLVFIFCFAFIPDIVKEIRRRKK